MKPILVQMAVREWTMQAMHFACAMARGNDAKVILLHLLPVSDIRQLGTSYGISAPSRQEHADLWEYTNTAEDYDVPFSIQPIQCLSRLDAVVEAAHQYDAQTVFAYIPKSYIPYWQRYQARRLEHRLFAEHRQLYTLMKPETNLYRVPSIVTEPIRSPRA